MDHVSVDDDFARFGAKSYAINKINSVEVRQSKPHGVGGVIGLGFVALTLLLQAIRARDNSVGGLLFFAVVCLGMAFVQWKKTKFRGYKLFLMTSSSETQAFVTDDAETVMSLRDRIEMAMARHSRAGTDR